MITLRRAVERRHDLRRRQEVWLTFDAVDRSTPHQGGFEPLEVLNEERFPPAAGVPRHFLHDAEIVTYVREGELAYETSTSGPVVIRAGEFSRVTAGRGLHVAERNPSRVDWAHVYQIWVRPSATGLEPSAEKRRFSAAQRRGAPCLVASPDGRDGSLRIHQDALIYSALLDPGQHVVHELAAGRRAWLHVVKGEVVLGQELLLRGDGAGITGERAASFTARAASELLLLDLGADEASPPARG